MFVSGIPDGLDRDLRWGPDESWFDRVGFGGCVAVRNAQGERTLRLVDSNRAVCTVPSLAIHLDREANKGKAINAEQHLNLVFGWADQIPSLEGLVETWGLEPGDEVLAYDLCAYPIQPSELVGLNGDFVLAPRLDNLLSCFSVCKLCSQRADLCRRYFGLQRS